MCLVLDCSIAIWLCRTWSNIAFVVTLGSFPDPLVDVYLSVVTPPALCFPVVAQCVCLVGSPFVGSDPLGLCFVVIWSLPEYVPVVVTVFVFLVLLVEGCALELW